MKLKDQRIELAKLVLELERIENEKRPTLPDYVICNLENILRNLKLDFWGSASATKRKT